MCTFKRMHSIWNATYMDKAGLMPWIAGQFITDCCKSISCLDHVDDQHSLHLQELYSFQVQTFWQLDNGKLLFLTLLASRDDTLDVAADMLVT